MDVPELVTALFDAAEFPDHDRALGAKEEKDRTVRVVAEGFKIALSLCDDQVRRTIGAHELLRGCRQRDSGREIPGVDHADILETGGFHFGSRDVVQDRFPAHSECDFFLMQAYEERIENRFAAVVHDIENVFRLLHFLPEKIHGVTVERLGK